jgi:hypothetical protein
MTGMATIDVGNVEMKRDEEGQNLTLIFLMAMRSKIILS